MKKNLLLLALACATLLPSASFAATDPCRGLATAEKKTTSVVNKKQKTVDKLQTRLSVKIEKFTNKQSAYDTKIVNLQSSAQGLDVKLSGCNPIGGFVGLIWNDATASSAACMSNNVVGGIIGELTGTATCGGECLVASLTGADYDICFNNCITRIEKNMNSCKKRASSVCSQIVRLRAKADGYEKKKAAYDPRCTGATPQACPSGLLRPIYIQIHGPNGDDATGAIADLRAAEAADANAAAALQCCQTGGTFTSATNACAH